MKCDIIRDLLPLYCDGLCSEASKQEIEAHVAQCQECRACLAEMKEEAPVPSLSQESETEARVLQEVKKKFSRGRRRAVVFAVAIMLIFSIVLAGAADVPQPVAYTDGLVTAELAVDEVIDLYYHGGSYDSFHGFSREMDGRNAVFLYFDRTLRSDVMPNREGHLCIGNGLLTDFETATYQVDRQVDAVYYLVGDYLKLPGLAQAEFEQAFCGNAEPSLQAECLGSFSRAAQAHFIFRLPIHNERPFSWSDRRMSARFHRCAVRLRASMPVQSQPQSCRGMSVL